jgi:hypothetical protein
MQRDALRGSVADPRQLLQQLLQMFQRGSHGISNYGSTSRKRNGDWFAKIVGEVPSPRWFQLSRPARARCRHPAFMQIFRTGVGAPGCRCIVQNRNS